MKKLDINKIADVQKVSIVASIIKPQYNGNYNFDSLNSSVFLLLLS